MTDITRGTRCSERGAVMPRSIEPQFYKQSTVQSCRTQVIFKIQAPK